MMKGVSHFGFHGRSAGNLVISLVGFFVGCQEVEVARPGNPVKDAVVGVSGEEVSEGLHLVGDEELERLGLMLHASLYLCDFSQVVAVLVNTSCEASVSLGVEGFLNPIEEGLRLVEQAELGRHKVLDLSEGDAALGAQESGVNRVVGTKSAGNGQVRWCQVVLDVFGKGDVTLPIGDLHIDVDHFWPTVALPAITWVIWVASAPGPIGWRVGVGRHVY